MKITLIPFNDYNGSACTFLSFYLEPNHVPALPQPPLPASSRRQCTELNQINILGTAWFGSIWCKIVTILEDYINNCSDGTCWTGWTGLTMSQMYRYILFFIKYKNWPSKLALLLTRGPLQECRACSGCRAFRTRIILEPIEPSRIKRKF